MRMTISRKWRAVCLALLTISLILPGVSRADTNLALNKAVSLDGTFFFGGWGGGAVVSPATLVDGVFLPRATQWDQGAVWWDSSFGPQAIIIDLDKPVTVTGLIVQADDNDSYRVSYWDSGWHVAWEIPAVGGYGMQTRPNVNDNSVPYSLPVPIVTNLLKFEATGGDGYYSVSEIQAFGTAAPLPGSLLLLGSGLLALGALRQRGRS